MFDKYLTKSGKLSAKQPQEVKNQWYINKFKQKHGGTYDYSKVVYLGDKTEVVIGCPTHGWFYQTPNNHLRGRGCSKCQNQNKQKDLATCISDFTQVHGDTYMYDKVCYVNNATTVLIGCKIHGLFPQKPKDHLEGKGCPKCGNSNQDTLYVLKCNTTGLIKIGITNNLTKRVRDIGGNLTHVAHIKTQDPRNLEKQLHKHYKEHNVFNPEVSNGGTEFFRLSDQQLHELIRYLNSF